MLSKEVLHSSHSSPSHMKEVKWSPSLTCFFWSNQFFKHERWMYFIVPEHLQGDIKWPSFKLGSSSPRQIRQVYPSIFSSYWFRIYSSESSFFFFNYAFDFRFNYFLVCSSKSISVLSRLSLIIDPVLDFSVDNSQTQKASLPILTTSSILN